MTEIIGKPFEKGWAGGPGRPKGSRNKLAESFLDALLEDFTTHGKSVLAKVREEQPVAYVNLVAGLLPKEATLNVNGSITHRSEPISELDGFLAEALPGRSACEDQKSLPA